MTYLVSAVLPASSNAERAADCFQRFDDEAQARECAEDWAKSGRREVALWQLVGEPKAKTVVDWELRK